MTREEANIHFLLHSASLVRELIRLELQPLGVGHSQARVLDALDRMGPSSQAELAKELGITPPSMSTLTIRMIANGHIDRQVDSNEKRSNVLRLSEAGAGLLLQIRDAWHRVDRMVQDKLGVEKTKFFFEASHALRDALGGRTPSKNVKRRHF